MKCETCGHNMQGIGYSPSVDEFWCPHCGCYLQHVAGNPDCRDVSIPEVTRRLQIGSKRTPPESARTGVANKESER